MSDNDKLLEEIKSIVEAMKSVGQYTQDLQRALQNTTRPMQEMSDYVKATAKAMEETTKSQSEAVKILTEIVEKNKEKTELDKESQRIHDEHIKALTEQMKLKQQMTVQDAAKAEEEGKKQAALQEHEKKRQEEAKKESELNAELKKRQSEILAGQVGLWDDIVNKAKNYGVEMAKGAVSIDEQTGKLKENKMLIAGMKASSYSMSAMTGASSMGGMMGMIGSSIGSLIPMMGGIGGIIGMIIHGVSQDEHFRAVGEKAAQIFDQVGGHSDKLVSQLGSSARTLSKWYGIAEGELGQVTTTLATLGVTSDEASEKIKGLSGIAGTNLVTAMLAADKAFEMNAGTMAKMAGTMSADFNMPIKEATISMINFGTAANKAGFNSIYMMQSAMQAASAFRLLNANASSVGGMSLSVANTMKGRGFGSAYSQQYASEGMSSALGGLAGMDVGLSAIIGEKMGAGSGLDAWYSLKSGSGASERGSDKLNIGDMLTEMKGIVEDMSPNRSEQAFALTKLLGVDVAGADAILDAMNEQAESGSLSRESLERLHGAFVSEGEKQNRILQMVEAIKDAVARGAVGLLGMIVNGIKYLIDAVQYGIASIMSSRLFNDDEASRAYNTELMKAYEKDMAGDSENFSRSWNRTKGAFSDIGKAGGAIFDVFAGASGAESAGDAIRAKALGKYIAATDKPLTQNQKDRLLTSSGALPAEPLEIHTDQEYDELVIIVKGNQAARRRYEQQRDDG